ncbi:hypothetical protein OsJ_32185 [Oryza sativa Japonica Group]|uniref:Uncharacterized protein n=1 Tax=Oryza sativa subsp. japonica TaxID=39947 RepID=A3C6J6_ORYSJ|nr:hypothetical protein OsJ_32185 [Oryza sativa Japonica Group]
MPGAAAGDEAAAAAGGRRPKASERRRMYRDLAQSLRCGLRRRVRGVLLPPPPRPPRGSSAPSDPLFPADADARLFRHSQALRDLQVVPVLFEHSLRRAQGDAVVTVGQVLGISPAVKLSNPATDSEVALALRVLEGCCLLCRDCAAAAHRYDAVKVLLNILMTRGTLEQKACLDTLLALMVDSSENLMDFKEHEGLDKIGDLVKDTQRDDNVRCSCDLYVLKYIERFNGSGLAKKSLSTTSMFSSDNY